MPDTGPKGYLGSVGTATLRDWAEDLLETRGGQVAAPVISYDSSTGLVSITSATTDAEIRYTTDGSEPTKGSTLYSAPFAVSGTVVVKAKGYKENVVASKTVEQTIVVAHVYGVMWDYGNPSPALTRLTPSNDPNGLATETITTEPVPSVDGSAGSSPFDTLLPWSGMKMRNITGTTLGPWEDESGFSLSTADVMVYLPDMWDRVIDDATNQKRYYYVSDNELTGFEKHPASGSYISRYFISSNSSSVTGDPGQATVTQFEAHRVSVGHKGAGWGIQDLMQTSYIGLLYLVEYANWDSVRTLGTGSSPSSGNSFGFTDAMPYHTGSINYIFQYRNLDCITNTLEYVDGTLSTNGVTYICLDPEKYSDEITSDYIPFGTTYTGSSLSGTITKFEYDADHQWLFNVPKEGGGTDSTYITDTGTRIGTSSSTANYVRMLMVRSGGSQTSGLFMYYQYETGFTNAASRLSYRPQAS